MPFILAQTGEPKKSKTETYAKVIAGVVVAIVAAVVTVVLVRQFAGEEEPTGGLSSSWAAFQQLFVEVGETGDAIDATTGALTNASDFVDVNLTTGTVVDPALQLRTQIAIQTAQVLNHMSAVESMEDLLQIQITGVADNRETLKGVANKMTIVIPKAFFFPPLLLELIGLRAERDVLVGEIDEFKANFATWQLGSTAAGATSTTSDGLADKQEEYDTQVEQLQLLEGQLIVLDPSYVETWSGYVIDWVNDPAHGIWSKTWDTVFAAKSALTLSPEDAAAAAAVTT